MEGSLADAVAVKGLDARVKVNLASLAVLNQLTGRELPDSGPLSLGGSLVSEEGLDAPARISGSLDGDGVRARVNGSIQDLLAANGVAVVLNVEGDSVTQLARLAGQAVRHDESLKFDGNLYVGSSGYKAEKLKLQMGPATLTGEAEYIPPGKEDEKSSLKAKVHIDQFDLEPYIVLAGPDPAPEGEMAGGADTVPEDSEPAADGKAASVADPSRKVFPAEPLPFELLHNLDADVEITADEFATHHLMYRDMQLKVVLDDGVLTVDPFVASVGEGEFDARAKLDASRKPAVMALDIVMEDGTGRHFGGRYDLKVDLDGTGNSVAEIMAGLDGQAIIDVRDLELEKSAMTQFGRSLTDSLNPFDKEKEKSELSCAIVRFDIDDGIANANNRIVAQMTRVTWFGGGTINLKTEQIGIGAQSKPRKGLGISLGNLASLVYVVGTLGNPKVQLNPKDVAVKYGHHYLTVMTGGAFLVLKGLWDKSRANSDVCARVLELGEEERVEQEAAGGDAVPQADAGAGTTGAPEAVPGPGSESGEVEDDAPAVHDLNL